MNKHKNLVESLMSTGNRDDGRSFRTTRSTVVNVKSLQHAEGSATVSLGSTKVICGIKAELAKPRAETPKEGYLVLNVELPPLCSPTIQSGPPTDEAQAATTLLSRIYKSAIDVEKLCIKENTLVWVLYVDIFFLNLNGGFLEAATFAATAALKTTSLPTIEINNDEIKVNVNKRQQPKFIKFLPYAASFALFDGICLQDPTANEENEADENLTIFTDKDGKTTIYHHPGSNAVTQEIYSCCEKIARERAQHLDKLLTLAQN